MSILNGHTSLPLPLSQLSSVWPAGTVCAKYNVAVSGAFGAAGKREKGSIFPMRLATFWRLKFCMKSTVNRWQTSLKYGNTKRAWKDSVPTYLEHAVCVVLVKPSVPIALFLTPPEVLSTTISWSPNLERATVRELAIKFSSIESTSWVTATNAGTTRSRTPTSALCRYLRLCKSRPHHRIIAVVSTHAWEYKRIPLWSRRQRVGIISYSVQHMQQHVQIERCRMRRSGIAL